MQFRRRTLFAVFLIQITFGSLIYVLSGPGVHATDARSGDEGLSNLNNAVGLDLTKYNVTAKEYNYNYSISYLDVAPYENVVYDIISNESKLRMRYTFTNGKLQMIYVLENTGSPNLKSPAGTNSLEMAMGFLNTYSADTQDSFYAYLSSTLNDIDANNNATKKDGNAQLEVSVNENYTTFKWTYTANGAIAPSKFVALGFNGGFLKYFVDNWQLHKIGSTNVNLSEMEAKAIALETASTHPWSANLNDDNSAAKNFDESDVIWTALLFDGSMDANKTRGSNPLVLYPVWRVGIALDKWYGNLYGLEVDIWADTKEVRSISEAYSSMVPAGVPTANGTESVKLTGQMTADSAAESNLALWIVFTIVVALIGVTILSVERKAGFLVLRKRFLKRGIGMPLFLTVLVTLLVPVAVVNAESRGAVVWGSESDGQEGYWRKGANEISHQQSTAESIASYFAANGYRGVNGIGTDYINHQGIENAGSNKSQIEYDISNLQINNNYVAVVHFDHGIGRNDFLPRQWTPTYRDEWHYMMEDNMGTIWGPYNNPSNHSECGVYDTEIWPLATPGKIGFAFINTCLSANLSIQDPVHQPKGQGPLEGVWPTIPERYEGMPYAWTHRLVQDKDKTPEFNIVEHMSDDGYSDPDDAYQVYIGFPWGSASLEQTIPYNTSETNSYHLWVDNFFREALYSDNSVNQALDIASLQMWGTYFGNSPLHTGFVAYWYPSAWANDHSTMVVYGNGNIHLNPSSNLVVRGYNNLIYYRSYDPNSGWGGWNSLPGGYTCDSPASTVCAGKQYFVVRSINGLSIWMNALDLGTQAFAGWTQIPGSTISAPSLVNNGTHLFLVVRGFTSTIHYNVYDCNQQAWTGWTLLPNGYTCDRPATAVLGNQLHVVVRGLGTLQQSRTLWHSIVNLADASFTGWTALAGSTDTAPALASAPELGSVCLTVRGTAYNQLWLNVYSSGWQGWTLLNGETCDGPAAVAKDGKLQLVVRGTDGYTLLHSTKDLATGAQTGWTTVNGSTPSPPTFASLPSFSSVFLDDFNDGNYNGWTVLQPEWSAASQKLTALQENALIRTNPQFAVDREVRVAVRNVSEGANFWDVPWVIAKCDSMWNNTVYGLIHTNGNVELSIFRNGEKLTWINSSSLDPHVTHAVDINVVGNRAFLQVDGVLYLNVTHDWLDDFGGAAALYTHASTGEFDDVTIFD